MRVGVFGAGAVGSYFGGKLARAGCDVVFVGRGDHLERMRRNGLVVKSVEGDFHVFAVTARSPAEVGVCDVVLLTVKAYDLGEAARSLDPMVGQGTTIIPLQNGVESEERLISLFGPERVVGGLCYVGAAVSRPGEVEHSAAGRIVIGELDGRLTIRLATLQNLFSEADIPVKLTEEIMAEKWKKLAWNVSFNAISALTRATVGRMLVIPETRELVSQAIAETVAVARAGGIMLDRDLPERVIEDNRVYANLKTSMLRDAERGSALEFEALNGAVCRAGVASGIPTPVNSFLYSLLKCMDPTVPGSSGHL